MIRLQIKTEDFEGLDKSIRGLAKVVTEVKEGGFYDEAEDEWVYRTGEYELEYELGDAPRHTVKKAIRSPQSPEKENTEIKILKEKLEVSENKTKVLQDLIDDASCFTEILIGQDDADNKTLAEDWDAEVSELKG